MATQVKHGMFHFAQPGFTIAGLLQPVTNAIAWLRKANQASADVRTLMSYDDRQLDDIGITRSQITSVVYGKERVPR